MTEHEHCPTYTSDLFRPDTFAEVCAWVVEKARDAGIEAIAGSGHSGLPVAAVVAHTMAIPLLAVRQRNLATNDNVHEVNGILPRLGRVRYGIVDDFIASGATIERITQEISAQWPYAEPTHIFCWWLGRSGTGRVNGIPVRLVHLIDDVTVVSRRPDLPF